MAGDLDRRPGLGRSHPSGQAAERDEGPAGNELQGRRGRATSCSATGPSPHWVAGDPADGPPGLSCSLSAVCCCSGGWNGWPGAAARWADSEGRPGRYPGAATRAERSGAPCSARSRRRRLTGSSRASVARTARSAQGGLGALTCRWSRGTWFAGSRSPHPWHRRTRQARRASRTRAAAQG